MTLLAACGIRAIVFDLDGTLYVSPEFADTIQREAVAYLSGILGTDPDQTGMLMTAARERLAEASGVSQTLSAVCCELGGTIRGLHGFFMERLKPEAYLKRDERVVQLMQRLNQRFGLYIYTNNNRVLTMRIIECLGLADSFDQVFTIDDRWASKPDEDGLGQVLAATGYAPEQVLFVGDRYDIDLRLPEQRGCPVFLIKNIEQLLRLEALAD